jgi:DsbC/DsbD-like thiol-disulfide interchange protein
MTAPTRRSLLLAGLALAAVGPAAAGPASPWVEGHRSRVRLVPGGSDGAAALAAIEIALAPGFKTYWRHPGESGLPPAFDWSGSENLASAEVLWPAPHRFEDGSGVSYGWAEGVVLPVRATPKDATRPVRLALALDYGVCKDICIPARATLSADLPPGAGAPSAPLRDALARVPRPVEVGAEGSLAILAAEPVGGGLKVLVRVPEGAEPRLFAEAPDGWYVVAAARPGPDGAFPVEVLERPRDAAGEIPVRLTLAAGERAVEASVRLDAARASR